MGTPGSHHAPCVVFPGADPWSRVIGYSFEIRSSWDLGSVTNVMEEPAVELPLLTGPERNKYEKKRNNMGRCN